LPALQKEKRTILTQHEAELRRVKAEMNNAQALLQEQEGAMTHWKVRAEDSRREVKDEKEKHNLEMKRKQKDGL